MPGRAAAAALAALLASVPARAQRACDGRPIRAINVTTISLFGIEEEPFPPLVQRLANSLHWRTRPRTVRRDLLFEPGEPCDLRRLEESERLLRAQGYVRSATVASRPAPGGAADVEVETRDDWTLLGSVSYHLGRRHPLRRVRIAEDNVLGRGIRAEARYRDLEGRAGLEVGVLDRHFLGTRRDFELVAGGSGVGALGEQTMVRAFESELDRVAWRESSRYRKEPFVLQSPRLGTVVQPLVSLGADAGIARRFGAPGQLRLVGLVASLERLTVEGPPLAIEPANDTAAVAVLAGRYTERRRIRMHLVLGARRLRFEQAAGVDALNALEDLRRGLEAGVVVGRTVGGGRGFQRDLFLAGELFGGWQPRWGTRTRLFARGKAEGRYLGEDRRWDNVIASAQLLSYSLLSERGTLVMGLTGAGGWHTSTPFQLLLAGSNGVRGHGSAGLPVGRRVLLQGEHRWFAGTVRGAVDVGTAAFLDLGQGWAGDAAFGAGTGLVGAIGGGLRLAFPSGSRRVYRVELAFPLDHGLGPELRIAFGHQLGISRPEADDVVRSREALSSATVFNFPRY